MNIERRVRLRWVVGLILVVGACTGRGGGVPSAGVPASEADTTQSASPIAISDPPVTLRLAIPDRRSADEVQQLVQQVATLSSGRITITPTEDAGGTGGEPAVAELLKRGDSELALTATRVWDLYGVTSLQALQAPFLIDNDALAASVAKSDVARRALDGMDGVVGLALWPLELRHYMTFPDCGKDFRTPAGLKGAAILSPASGVSRSMLRIFGATEWQGEDRGVESLACTLQGAEAPITTLDILPMESHPTALADVTPFPKFMVLVANDEAFGRLSASQQAVLQQAANAVEADAFTRQRIDANAAAAWCAAGGAIELAGTGAQEAFRKAVAPVYLDLEGDPLTKELIADIRQVAKSTPRSPGAEPCSPSAGPEPVAAGDLAGYGGTPFPNGTYRRELVADKLITAGVSRESAEANAPGRLTLIFNGTAVTQIVEHGTQVERCEGTSESDGTVVRMHTASGPGGCEFNGEVVWRPEPDGISFVVIPFGKIPASDRALLDHWVWTRIK